jgi:hypothetical protein
MKFLPAKDHLKLTFQFIFTAFAIGLAIWFFYHEKDEISDIGSTLHQASIPWLIAGLVLVLVYIMLQAEMYRQAFKVYVRASVS